MAVTVPTQIRIDENIKINLKNDKLKKTIIETYKVNNLNKTKGFHNVDGLFKDMGYAK